MVCAYKDTVMVAGMVLQHIIEKFCGFCIRRMKHTVYVIKNMPMSFSVPPLL